MMSAAGQKGQQRWHALIELFGSSGPFGAYPIQDLPLQAQNFLTHGGVFSDRSHAGLSFRHAWVRVPLTA